MKDCGDIMSCMDTVYEVPAMYDVYIYMYIYICNIYYIIIYKISVWTFRLSDIDSQVETMWMICFPVCRTTSPETIVFFGYTTNLKSVLVRLGA